ncbi:hypothetical protein Ef18B233LT_19110 [Escherichia fergusonii]|uniref:Uncharacterized protein n=1 Tax=Escherichia fergusonii (strain ATCC 35469 / DSM 13698 / CCUG 18766 / IAM 14443 / JCM 21226 / LMG 7866 / NBRC 102419 / NCTC 12128 / CDC 0568-73) TaxID=585054 RepID=B7LQU0_ESCF3|nr:hypothetical protein [Escherichia fergusonii]EFF0771432.1 hypothetical protein [Escherichia fergusonii]EHG6171545.1 hypothetical protein [Escherichia fergusonii]EHT2456025.1 hypothetical protein [Escherichia fergusonii]EIH2134689.1 hypothetical protein [Escherichia fergusonii]EIH2154234.1 hypothetical protein [Escherichia fergusonii]
MKKSYFLKYGGEITKEEINKLLDDKWDVSCSEYDSSYFGVYYSYSGIYADKLMITDNYIPIIDEWLDEENKKFKTLIKVSIVNGKNADKLSRYKTMKNILNDFDKLFLISEECIEESD